MRRVAVERTTTMVVVGTTREVEQGTGEQVLAFRIGEENRKLAGKGDSWSGFFLERIAGGELE